jgi:hypothetical protein
VVSSVVRRPAAAAIVTRVWCGVWVVVVVGEADGVRGLRYFETKNGGR